MRPDIQRFKDSLYNHELFQAMASVTENSPWHREKNVLVHTDMVIDSYVKQTDTLFGHNWSKTAFLGLVASAFHDVGKPAAMVEKFSESRGKYKSFHGHELISARKYANICTTIFPSLSAVDHYFVTWMIENHLLWASSSPDVERNINATIKSMKYESFWTMVLADQYGRISDDEETKIVGAKATVDRVTSLVTAELQLPETADLHDIMAKYGKVMIVPIGPSGCGKSTLYQQLPQKINVFSLDLMRHQLYDTTDYRVAYEKSVKDANFASKAQAAFVAEMRKDSHIFIDNTNLSRKRRRQYLVEAKHRGYTTVAVYMSCDQQVVEKRQGSRKDKSVPLAAVAQHYSAVSTPSYHEFDVVLVRDYHTLKSASNQLHVARL